MHDDPMPHHNDIDSTRDTLGNEGIRAVLIANIPQLITLMVLQRNWGYRACESCCSSWMPASTAPRPRYSSPMTRTSPPRPARTSPPSPAPQGRGRGLPHENVYGVTARPVFTWIQKLRSPTKTKTARNRMTWAILLTTSLATSTPPHNSAGMSW